MSNPKKTHELIRQNEQIVKKSQKHDANLQKNSTLYFQVGLIICLFMVYGLFEMKFESEIPKESSFNFYYNYDLECPCKYRYSRLLRTSLTAIIIGKYE